MPEDALVGFGAPEVASVEIEDIGRSSPPVSKSRIDIGRRRTLPSAGVRRSKEVSSPPPGESTRYEPRRLREERASVDQSVTKFVRRSP